MNRKKTTASKPNTPATSRPGSPTKVATRPKTAAPGPSTLAKSDQPSAVASASKPSTSQLAQDLKGLGLEDDDITVEEDLSTLPTITIAKEKLIENLKLKEQEANYKPVLSMVVIGTCSKLVIEVDACSLHNFTGHVDAGKSTLMGRMLAELGEMSKRAVEANLRQSEKMGKGSFAYAWAFDARPEERER